MQEVDFELVGVYFVYEGVVYQVQCIYVVVDVFEEWLQIVVGRYVEG